MGRVEEQEICWPGVDSKGRVQQMRKIGSQGDRMVEVNVGAVTMDLYADTGCKFTLIPPKQYKVNMGKVMASDTYLRGWGAKTFLDGKGMFHTTLSRTGGARTDTWVYVVDGYRPEALLGDRDAVQRH